MITNKAKKNITLSFVLFVFALGSVLAAWTYVISTGENLLQKTKEVADYNVRTQTYATLSQLVEQTKQERKELASYVLTEKKIIDFLTEIEKVAVEQGVELTTNSVQKNVQEGLFDEAVISFLIEGTDEYVKNMLHIFETLPYHGYVSKLSLVKNEDDRTVDANIDLTVSLLNYDR